MRFSDPSIADAVAEVRARGAQRVLGVILSPQYSATLMGGYDAALQLAAGDMPMRIAGAWHLNPAFVDVLASRIRDALVGRTEAPVLLTAHSLPRRVVDREPDYIQQLRDTAVCVAHAAGLSHDQWSFVYQSAGHTPEEWLKPDLLDVLPGLAGSGHRDVIVAPVQFLADHLETLYDIDIAGRDQAREAGIDSFIRTEAPNAAPDFIDALALVVRGEVAVWRSPTPQAARA
jgi:ferrochelatase